MVEFALGFGSSLTILALQGVFKSLKMSLLKWFFKKFGKTVKLLSRSRLGFCFLVLSFGLAINFCYQIYRHPIHLLSLLHPGEAQTPMQIWKSYSEDFKSYSTNSVSSELLAALAVVESNGKSWATPSWNLQSTTTPENLFAPATSAFGLMQITDGHFKETKSDCIRSKTLYHNCWMNFFTSRVFASHSIEMAAVYIHKQLEAFQKKLGRPLSSEEKVSLASVTHLCGKNWLFENVTVNLKIENLKFKRSSCGAQNVRTYISRVKKYYHFFHSLNSVKSS